MTPHTIAAALDTLADNLAATHPYAITDRLRDTATLIRTTCPPDDPTEDNDQ